MPGEVFNFEKALEELNNIVTQMEQGGLPLEESLALFEKGIALTRQCQNILETAEQKVQIILERNEGISAQPYDAEVV